MSLEHAIDDSDDLVETGTYTVNVYGANARLLREYCMEADEERISTLEEAASRARENLEACNFSDVILVVTEEAPGDFNQLQIKIGAAVAEPVKFNHLGGAS